MTRRQLLLKKGLLIYEEENQIGQMVKIYELEKENEEMQFFAEIEKVIQEIPYYYIDQIYGDSMDNLVLYKSNIVRLVDLETAEYQELVH